MAEEFLRTPRPRVGSQAMDTRTKSPNGVLVRVISVYVRLWVSRVQKKTYNVRTMVLECGLIANPR